MPRRSIFRKKKDEKKNDDVFEIDDKLYNEIVKVKTDKPVEEDKYTYGKSSSDFVYEKKEVKPEETIVDTIVKKVKLNRKKKKVPKEELLDSLKEKKVEEKEFLDKLKETSNKKNKEEEKNILNKLKEISKEEITILDGLKKKPVMKEQIITKEEKKIDNMKENKTVESKKEKMISCNVFYNFMFDLTKEKGEKPSIVFFNDKDPDTALFKIVVRRAKKQIFLLEFANNKWNRKSIVELKKNDNIKITTKLGKNQIPIKIMNCSTLNVNRINNKVTINKMKWDFESLKIV
jgi:hypothetical protein